MADDDDDEGAQTCKVVLLGESGVGKTCIIARFINNTFEENLISTTGASYAGKTMTFDEFGGKSIKFEIWDTAGQEKYRSLTKIFYKDAGAAILVYDITRQDSFDEIKKYWLQQIKEFAPKDISKLI
jgi:small GTP-binding protein